jgi:peptidyl-prolyl cis-trans isomerase SurA
MRYCIGRSWFTVVLVFFIALPTAFSKEQKPVVEGVAAIVGDNIILKSELAQLVNMTAIQRKINPNQNPEMFLLLQDQVLQSIIDQKIILEMAELDTNITIKEKEIDAALEMQIENIISQAGNEERAETALGQSLLDFKREFWYDVRDRLFSERLQQSLLASITINRDEVMHFYETYQDSLPLFPTQVKLRHILMALKPGEKSIQNSRNLLDSLRQEIKNGAAFEDLAAAYSQDPGSRSQGGDLGFVRRGSLVKEFEEAAFNLEPGLLSTIIETDFGFHLIQGVSRQGEKVRVRHILITPQVTEEDESNAFQTASAVRDSATTLPAYKRLAAEHSIDERTKDIGGDLGWIDPSTYHINEIGQVVGLLNLNECSPPVKSGFGYHLLWIEGVREGGVPDLDRHWTDIEAMALNKKKMDHYQNWLTETRKNFYIEIKD